MGYIYSIYNKISKKRYIGQTIQPLNKRINQHFYLSKKGIITPLYNAIRKYQKSDFIIDIVEKCDKSLLNEREQYWIKHYNTFAEGYNCDLGGSGTKSFKHSKETKRKMSESKKGKPSGRKGKINSPESNKKRSESLKKSYEDGTRKKRDYSDISGSNNKNYKTGKYTGYYARYKQKTTNHLIKF
jgi:group I intron endonuclease